jgi:hypothetical protein
MQSLTTHLKKRQLVSVVRQGVDGYGVQGFVVGVSDTLLALEYVYDFQIDGILILRRSDITDVKRTATDKFQEKLMAAVGLRAGSQEPQEFDLDGWPALIKQLSNHYPFMIVERELGPSPQLVIGRPLKLMKTQIEFRSFSGTGKWSLKARRIKYSQITSLQVNTRYVNFYQQYLQRGAT